MVLRRQGSFLRRSKARCYGNIATLFLEIVRPEPFWRSGRASVLEANGVCSRPAERERAQEDTGGGLSTGRRGWVEHDRPLRRPEVLFAAAEHRDCGSKFA